MWIGQEPVTDVVMACDVPAYNWLFLSLNSDAYSRIVGQCKPNQYTTVCLRSVIASALNEK